MVLVAQVAAVEVIRAEGGLQVGACEARAPAGGSEADVEDEGL